MNSKPRDITERIIERVERVIDQSLPPDRYERALRLDCFNAVSHSWIHRDTQDRTVEAVIEDARKLLAFVKEQDPQHKEKNDAKE